MEAARPCWIQGLRSRDGIVSSWDWAVTSTAVVEVRRRRWRKNEGSERILVFVAWMTRSGDGYVAVKVQQWIGMAGWRLNREGRRGIAIPISPGCNVTGLTENVHKAISGRCAVVRYRQEW